MLKSLLKLLYLEPRTRREAYFFNFTEVNLILFLNFILKALVNAFGIRVDK